jgi:uncharacterized short protein YbdD (DUF466 family)
VTGIRAQPAWWVRLGELVRAIIGAPSYDRYLDHVRSAHPERSPLGRDDFIRRRLDERYSKPGARCC